MTHQPARVSPTDARVALTSGVNEAVLVCAYDDEQKCRENMLEGAITLRRFEQTLAGVPRSHEIIFYCA